MKKLHLFLVTGVCCLNLGCEACRDGEIRDPDLAFLDWDYFHNDCIDTTEYLYAPALYWIRNPDSPTGPSFILLYWRADQELFFDCAGKAWYVFPGPGQQLLTYRRFINRPAPWSPTATARAPAAQSFTSVTLSDGSDLPFTGPVVVFPDLAPGQKAQLETSLSVSWAGRYRVTYEVDPEHDVEERNEANNILTSHFERGQSARPESFVLRNWSEEELAAAPRPFAVYRDGRIEVYK
jgi:hypothetical protein